MPPKNSGRKAPKAERAVDNGAKADTAQDHATATAATVGEETKVKPDKKKKNSTNGTKSSVPSKRKANTSNEPSKVPRRSARGNPPATVDPIKILRFLLSPASLDICRPKDEIENIKERGADIKTYSSSTFTPFEELVCAVVLSRPISHALGLRSIRTLFNEPYEYTTPKKFREAGKEGIIQALNVARTQHRQKTAEELNMLADAIIESLGDGEDDTSLERVRKEADYDVNKEREMLQSNVKGLGKTGLDIFFRRTQGVWPESYPFVDPRTLSAIEKLGLPNDANELRKLLDHKWAGMTINDMKTDDDEEKRRKAFVRVLERAVGADLEGKVDVLKAEAEKLT